MRSVAAYRGRFAPSPSGPLHFGSIVAAAGSRADALAHGGEWHLRLDDLDPPRVAPGADSAILRCLEALGMEWQGPLVRQSQRTEAYAAALEHLTRSGRVYPCTCSRAEVARAGLPGVEGPRYPGTCRDGPAVPGRAAALRLRLEGEVVRFHDALQGEVSQALAEATGDFVLRRADGVYAYHLACVVDDAAGGFDHVVRGADLLDSTGRQLLLHRLLGQTAPTHLHLPVAADPHGQKLSKQSGARAADTGSPAALLARAFAFLGHPVPAEVTTEGPAALWAWVATAWHRERLPRLRQAPAPAAAL